MFMIPLQERVKNHFTPGKINFFKPEDMAIAVANKKIRKLKKGITFNCAVLDTRKAHNSNDLVTFLILLEQKKLTLPDLTRLQMVFVTGLGSGHWTTIDVQIQNKKLSFFILDAADSILPVMLATVIIHENCPDASIKYCGGKIQFDDGSCDQFAFDHAVCLSKIPNLHEELDKLPKNKPNVDKVSKQEFASFKDRIHSSLDRGGKSLLVNLSNDIFFICEREEDVKERAKVALSHLDHIDVDILPSTFSSLLRNTQSITQLNKIYVRKDFTKAKGNDKELLPDYLAIRNKRFGSPEFSEDSLIGRKK
jgi:hypothetical protein